MRKLFRYDEESSKYVEQTLTVEKFGELLNLLQRVAEEEVGARYDGSGSLSDDLLCEIEATLAISRAESSPMG